MVDEKYHLELRPQISFGRDAIKLAIKTIWNLKWRQERAENKWTRWEQSILSLEVEGIKHKWRGKKWYFNNII